MNNTQYTLLLPSEVLNKKFDRPQSNNHSDSKQQSKFKNTDVIKPYVFKIGELGMLLDTDNILSEVIDELPNCQIPNAAPWLYSIANLRGNITPIFNLMNIFNYDNNNEPHKLLIIGEKNKALGIVIDEIPYRIELNNNDKIKLATNLPTRLTPHVRCCYQKNNTLWVDWDIFGFFNALQV